MKILNLDHNEIAAVAACVSKRKNYVRWQLEDDEPVFERESHNLYMSPPHWVAVFKIKDETFRLEAEDLAPFVACWPDLPDFLMQRSALDLVNGQMVLKNSSRELVAGGELLEDLKAVIACYRDLDEKNQVHYVHHIKI